MLKPLKYECKGERVERFWYLKNSELFEGLPDKAYDRLEQSAVVRKFGRGETIYLPGQPGSNLLALFEGRVKLKCVTPEGKESILAFIEPGEIFGELGLFDDSPRGEFAEAAVSSVICALPKEAVLRLISEHPETALRITKIVGLRRQRIENRIKNMLFRSFRDRIAALLIEMSQRYGKPNGDHIEIGLRLSHQEIASLIGATRETVTLLLGELQNEGYIRVTRRQITVTDPDGLADKII